MCGIVGFITNEQEYGAKVRKMYMEQALILDSIRGKDSTGIFTLEHSTDNQLANVLKSVGDGFAFTNTPEYQAYTDDIAPYRAIVGHNRASTRGKVNTANAHPYQEGDITLVHNGTLMAQTLPFKLHSKEMNKLDIDVDSHAMTYSIAKEGAEAVFKDLDGAYATIWHDRRTDAIYVLRNEERPLHFVRSRQQDTLFFASEAEMLVLLMDSMGHKYGAIYSPNVGHMYTFEKGELTPSSKKMEMPVKKPQAPTYMGTTGGYQTSPTSTYTGINYTKGKHDLGYSGTYVQIPSALALEIKSVGLSIYSYYPFEPKTLTSIAVTGTRSAGILGCKAMSYDAVIYSMPRTVMPTNGKRWTVQPVAIRYKDSDKKVAPTIICRYVSLVEIPEAVKWAIETNQDLERQSNRSVGDLVVGAYGVMLTDKEYLDQTEAGCAVCQDVIQIDDAPDIFWLEDENVMYPMCEGCSAGMLMADASNLNLVKDTNVIITNNRI